MAFCYYCLSLGIPLVAVGYWMYRVVFVNGAVCKSKARLDGKTVIITGANTGIGKETAIDLARRGGRIILACRSQQRGEDALTEICRKSGSKNVDLRQLDLASCASIHKFAKEILLEEEEINILINNAGIMRAPYQLTKDGFESQFGINHLGHFLLTHLLLDRIKESAPSRIINVSSRGHRRGTLDFNDMMWSEGYDRSKAYCRSKLANVMFTRELAKRLSGNNVTVCSLHPGIIYTELGRYMLDSYSYPMRVLGHLVSWLLIKTPKQGAQTTIHCAVAREVEGVTGKYWEDCAVKQSSSQSRNDEDCILLWEYSARLLGTDTR